MQRFFLSGLLRLLIALALVWLGINLTDSDGMLPILGWAIILAAVGLGGFTLIRMGQATSAIWRGLKMKRDDPQAFAELEQQYERYDRLNRIMDRLGSDETEFDAEDIYNQMMQKAMTGELTDREQAQEELLDWAMSNPEVDEILDEYGADKQILRKIFSQLERAGGGQYVGRNPKVYVPAAAITKPSVLADILDKMEDIEADGTRDFWMQTAYDLVVQLEENSSAA